MRKTETNHHRLQEIRLLLKFHTQLASTDKITGLTINMKFSPAGQQQEIKTDNHSRTLENYNETSRIHGTKPIYYLETWLTEQRHELLGKDAEAMIEKEI